MRRCNFRSQARAPLAVAFCLSIATLIAAGQAGAADKNAPFRAKPAGEYPNRQKQGAVTIAADAYSERARVTEAFGKLKLQDYGVLPVLIVFENTGGQAIDLSRMRLEYVDSSGERIEPVPANEVQYLNPPDKPKVSVGIPGLPSRKKKNPLASPVIEERGFAAKMLPPGDSAHGFVYFQTDHRPGAMLYMTGLREAGSGKELFYLEIPFEQK